MPTTLQILTIVLSGAAVASVVFAFYSLGVDNAFKKRLTQIFSASGVPPADKPSSKPVKSLRVAAVVNILSKLSLPDEGWQSSAVRVKFLQAGIRNQSAPQYYFAIKTLLTLVFPVLLALFLVLNHPKLQLIHIILFALLTAAAGYYLPELLLRFITQGRIERMRNGLPDMIELMVICTEAGMSIDAASTRISREMARSYPDLSQEFYLSSLEMRAGATRLDALRNMALRVGLEEFDDLVSVLIQADKFGTSQADSLRVHSDVMRTRRSQRAEELANKVPVKMLLPLILFIFPTLLIVLLGPAIIRLLDVLSQQ